MFKKPRPRGVSISPHENTTIRSARVKLSFHLFIIGGSKRQRPPLQPPHRVAVNPRAVPYSPTTIHSTIPSRTGALPVNSVPSHYCRRETKNMVETTYRRLLPIKLTEAFIFLSFWLFGTVVTMQYKVVLTAANEYVFSFFSSPPSPFRC